VYSGVVIIIAEEKPLRKVLLNPSLVQVEAHGCLASATAALKETFDSNEIMKQQLT
jgi:hypothetical protein